MAEQQQDVDTLKRRGRRPLVGAVGLVLPAVTVLPMVFDPEPRRTAPPVSVRIPGEDDSAFTPKAPPKPAPAPKIEEKKDAPEKTEKATAPPVAAKNAEAKNAEAKNAEAKKAEAKKPEPKSVDRSRAEAAL